MFCPADCPLTEREYEVATLLARGLSRHEIAESLGVDLSTVRSHVLNATTKLDAHSAAQLVARMYANGWITSDGHVEQLLEDSEARLAKSVARLQDERGRQRLPAAGQSLYLHAFERWLRDPHNETKAMERALCLRAMYHESSWRSQDAGGERIIPPWEQLGQPQPRRRTLVHAKVFPMRIETVRPDGPTTPPSGRTPKAKS